MLASYLFLWKFSFFGLTPEYKRIRLDQCLELGYYSEGAFSFESAYNLPIAWRIYAYNWLADKKKKEQEQIDNANKGKKGPPKVNRPHFDQPSRK
jgi:hypothetical protein